MDETQVEEQREAPHHDGTLWSISAVSRKTGLTSHVLRAWERRFGTPTPVRLPSGHRRYTQDQVERLALVAQALGEGHRAGDVVPLSIAQLQELLSVAPLALEPGHPQPQWLGDIMGMVEAFDREGLLRTLRREASALGIAPFLKERVVPLLYEVGEAWHRREIQIRHEHFMTDLLLDLLRQLRTDLEIPAAQAEKPLILLCTLPHELHGLGLQLVALLLSLYQWPLHILGVQTPLAEITSMAKELSPYAIGISVSPHSAHQQTQEQIAALRQQLPRNIALWLGGAGARQLALPPGSKIFATLDELEQRLQSEG